MQDNDWGFHDRRNFLTEQSVPEIDITKKILIIEKGNQKDFIIVWPKYKVAGMFLVILMYNQNFLSDSYDFVPKAICMTQSEQIVEYLDIVHGYDECQSTSFSGETIRDLLWREFFNSVEASRIIKKDESENIVSTLIRFNDLSDLAIKQLGRVARDEMKVLL